MSLFLVPNFAFLNLTGSPRTTTYREALSLGRRRKFDQYLADCVLRVRRIIPYVLSFFGRYDAIGYSDFRIHNCMTNDTCTGWGAAQATIRNGARWGTYNAFLKRTLSRESVHIVTHAVVQKVTVCADNVVCRPTVL